MPSFLPPTPDAMIQTAAVRRWHGMACTDDDDALVVEEPLEIRLNDQPLAITMRTPGQDDALAVGFLVTEGLLRTPDDLFDVVRCGHADQEQAANIVTVYVRPDSVPAELPDTRQRYAASSCGLCGAATIEAVRKLAPPIPCAPRLSRAALCGLPAALRGAQAAFDRTGGLHAAGLFSPGGALLFVEEDVGRHNAVDKVVGRAFLAGRWPLGDTILMASGRAGFEIVQKALVARIPAVCSVSAPSSLAADLARESGMVLVGFLRGDRMNVYAGGDCVIP